MKKNSQTQQSDQPDRKIPFWGKTIKNTLTIPKIKSFFRLWLSPSITNREKHTWCLYLLTQTDGRPHRQTDTHGQINSASDLEQTF